MIRNDVAITPDLVKEHGLTPDEYQRFVDLIGRTPTLTELGIVSAMWNEHCSYKSSRLHLRGLPTKAPWVIQGPGENAGVIDIGDGLACVFKMESHNHPSFIEPYQGATTGVGGILRDVFTMGARPIACLNFLRFGEPDHPKTPHLVSGVVAGIGGYGNSFGVPTVGGSVGFHPRYNGNILVNAMAVGLARTNEIFYAAATGVGNPIVYLGSKTGRDGIHGATMASAEFDDASDEKRPTVQVGDPFAEKLLLEACLELMKSGAVIAIQDMGAAGLTSSAVEMGAKGNLGVELDLDKVPCREEGMTAYEMMLSESQERMLMVLKPGMEKEAEAIFVKWGLDFAIIGKTTDTLRFVVKHHGEVMADLPIKEMGDEAPLYDRPHVTTPAKPVIAPESVAAPMSGCGCPSEARRLARPELATLGLGAIRPPDPRQHRADARRRRGDRARRERAEGPGADHRRQPALLRSRPVRGRQAGGGRGLAQHHGGGRRAARDHRQPEFRQSGAPGSDGPVRRLPARHRRGLPRARLPRRVGQRVSLQRDQRPGHPADPRHRRRRRSGRRDGPRLGRLQARGRRDHPDRRDGRLARTIDLSRRYLRPRGRRAAPGRSGDRNVATAISCASSSARDRSTPSTIARMAALRSRSPKWRWRAASARPISAEPEDLPRHAFLFGEDQGRYVLAVPQDAAADILYEAAAIGVPAALLGMTGGAALILPGEQAISVAALKTAHESWLPDYMAGKA